MILRMFQVSDASSQENECKALIRDECNYDCQEERQEECQDECCDGPEPSDYCDDCDHCSDIGCQDNVGEVCQDSQDECDNESAKQSACGNDCCEVNKSIECKGMDGQKDTSNSAPEDSGSSGDDCCQDTDNSSAGTSCGEVQQWEPEKIQRLASCLRSSGCASLRNNSNSWSAMDFKAKENVKVERKEPCDSHLENAMLEYLAIVKLGQCICLEVMDRLAKFYEKSLLMDSGTRARCRFHNYHVNVRSCLDHEASLVRKPLALLRSSRRSTSCLAPCCKTKTRRSSESERDYSDCFSSSSSVAGWKTSRLLFDNRKEKLKVQSQSSGSLLRKRNVKDLEAGLISHHALFKVSGMTCTGCAKKVINSLKGIEGISSVKAIFVTSTVEFDYDPDVCDIAATTTRLVKETGFAFSHIKRNHQSLVVRSDRDDFGKVEDLVEIIEKVGKQTYKITYDPSSIGARDILKGAPGITLADDVLNAHKSEKRQLYSLLWKTIVSAILTIPVLVLAWSDVDVPYSASSITQLVLATCVQAVAVPEFYVRALKSLIYSRAVEMDMLVVISITAAYVYSVVAFGLTHAGHELEQEEFFETSTLLITLVLFGRLLATAAKLKAVSAISVNTLQTNSAILVENETASEIDSRLLQYDDIFLVKPHGKIVTDGLVVEGESTVDESIVTGESTAIRKSVNDVVIAGSLNGPSSLKVKVSRLPGDNSIADIVELVENALAEKPKAQDLADTIAGYFIPVVIFISLLVLVIWIIINLRVKNKGGGAAFSSAITYGIAVMAISCPCALGLAVPMVLVVAGGVAARKGVLITSSSVLERGCKITDIVFDKTGTLTSSALVVENAEFYPCDYSTGIIKNLVDVLTKDNDHPTSVAIKKYLENFNDRDQLAIPTNIESVPGSGIRGLWEGKTIMVGNMFWLNVSESPQVLSLLKQNHSIVCATIDDVLVASFCMKAPLREEANGVIEQLGSKNITCHIVSGDTANAVTAVANSVEIPFENVRYQFSPKQKLEYVLELMQNGKNVLFCGDGTNDAVAVAQASVGVNIGSSSDITLATADVVLCGGLEGINKLLGISRRSFRIISFNFVWAFVYNLVAILAAAGAFVNFRIPPAYAGVGEVVSVLPVIFAAMTLVIG